MSSSSKHVLPPTVAMRPPQTTCWRRLLPGLEVEGHAIVLAVVACHAWTSQSLASSDSHSCGFILCMQLFLDLVFDLRLDMLNRVPGLADMASAGAEAAADGDGFLRTFASGYCWRRMYDFGLLAHAWMAQDHATWPLL